MKKKGLRDFENLGGLWLRERAGGFAFIMGQYDQPKDLQALAAACESASAITRLVYL
jgi:hypothetical protein